MRPGQTPWGHVGWLGSRADCSKPQFEASLPCSSGLTATAVSLRPILVAFVAVGQTPLPIFGPKNARFSVMEGPQDCFKHVLIRRQFSWLPMCDCNICNALNTGFSHVFCVGFIGLGSISSLQVAWLSRQTWTWWKPSSAATLELAWLPKCERERLGISKLRECFIWGLYFLWGHTSERGGICAKISGRVDRSIDKARDLACGPQRESEIVTQCQLVD